MSATVPLSPTHMLPMASWIAVARTSATMSTFRSFMLGSSNRCSSSNNNTITSTLTAATMYLWSIPVPASATPAAVPQEAQLALASGIVGLMGMCPLQPHLRKEKVWKPWPWQPQASNSRSSKHAPCLVPAHASCSSTGKPWLLSPPPRSIHLVHLHLMAVLPLQQWWDCNVLVASNPLFPTARTLQEALGPSIRPSQRTSTYLVRVLSLDCPALLAPTSLPLQHPATLPILRASHTL